MRAALLAGLVLACAVAGARAPGHDAFAAAEPLDLVGRVALARATTVEATTEAGEPEACGVTSTVWYVVRLAGGAAGGITVQTTGSGFDTVLAVHEGASLADLRLVACNDDAPGRGGASEVSFTAVPGRDYHVQVGGSSLKPAEAIGDLRLMACGATSLLPLATPPPCAT